jgi:hypothetical protein
MVILDFRVDADTLAQDLDHQPALASPAALEETYFVMPVRFAIGGTELLSVPGQVEPWRRLPLIGFSTDLHKTVALLGAQGATCYLAGGGELRIRPQDGFVGVTSSLSQTTAVAPMHELLEAVDSFCLHVRGFLATHVPDLHSHQSWVNWWR